jgi:hypothetical protein
MIECDVKYKIYDLTEDAAMLPEEGELLYHQLRAALDAGNSVELDFEGVVLAAPPFMSRAIGDLYEHCSADDLARRLTFTNLAPLVAEVIETTKEHSINYFSYDKATQIAMSKVWEKYIEVD